MTRLDLAARLPGSGGPSRSRDNLRGAARAMAAEAARIGLAVPSMILVARALTPGEFGSFSGALALLSIVFPFSCWAIGHVLIRAMARKQVSLEQARSAAVSVLLKGWVFATLLLVAFGPWFLPSLSRVDLTLLTLSELLATNGMAVCSQIASAERDFSTVLRLAVILGAARLVAAVAFASLGGNSLSLWVEMYAAASLAAVAAMVSTTRPLASWRPRNLPEIRLPTGGSPFVLSAASAEIIDDADKVALVHYGHVGDAGVYAIAYRVAALVGMPARALLFVTYPQFFELGHREPSRLRGYAAKQMLIALVPTLLVAGCAIVLAPTLVWLLGDAYQPAVGYLRWLALVPILRLIGYYAADVLTGLDRQWLRASMQAVGAAITVLLLVLLVPTHGASAAIVVSIVVDGLIAVAAWLVALLLTVRRRLATS